MGLWPRPTDHEQVSDIGWLLYSSRYQNKARVAEMLSNELGIRAGARWRQIRTTDSNKRNQGNANPDNVVRALHLEGSSHRIHDIKERLSSWYGSSANNFIDGTKMRLIPPYQSVISAADKGKYGAVVARQSTFLSRLATGTTSEFASNLILDRPHPVLRTTLRQVLMEIKSAAYPDFPVFHSVDRTWRSDSSITFTFLPENESDARMYIAGLVPYLRDTQDSWFLKFFTKDARARHQSSVWDPITKQVSSTSDVWIRNALALDDELNFTDTPTASWMPSDHVQFDMPDVTMTDETPAMYQDQDSVSTFHPSGRQRQQVRNASTAAEETKEENSVIEEPLIHQQVGATSDNAAHANRVNQSNVQSQEQSSLRGGSVTFDPNI